MIYIYKSADQILIPSENFRNNIKKKINNKKILYVPNSSFNFNNKKKNINFKLVNKWKKKNFLYYSGNIGKAQGLENFLFAAKKIKSKKIFFIFTGDGSEKKKLLEITKILNLNNVIFTGSLNFETVNEFLKHAKASIISLKDDKLFNNYIPNKFQNYLVCRKPMLVCAEGVLVNLVRKNKIGFTSKPGNIIKLVNNIIRIMNLSKKELKLISRNSKNLFDKQFSSSIQQNKIIKFLNLK